MERRSLSQLFTGLVAALFSIAILLGSFAITIAQAGKKHHPPLATSALPPLATTIIQNFQDQILVPTTSIQSPSEEVVGSHCPPPIGWQVVVVEPGDTLQSFAASYGTTAVELKLANCLIASDLIPGTYINVPLLPSNQATSTTTPHTDQNKPPNSLKTLPTTEQPPVTTEPAPALTPEPPLPDTSEPSPTASEYPSAEGVTP